VSDEFRAPAAGGGISRLVHQQAIIGGTITAGAGTMTVVTIVLTGRPAVPRRKIAPASDPQGFGKRGG
jgi:hypothetical protein